MRLKLFTFAIILFFANTTILLSQDQDLVSPYQTVYTHLKYLQEEDYDLERSATAFALSKDSIQARKNAIQLKQIWDSKGMYVFVDKIPHDSNFVDSLNKENIYTIFPKEMPEIYLIKKEGNWYYSALSNNSINKIHQELFPFGISKFLANKPSIFTNSLLGLQIWQWIALSVLLICAYLLRWIFSKIFQPLIQNTLVKKWGFRWTNSENVHKLSKYLALLLVFQFLHMVLPIIMLPIDFSKKLFLLLYLLKALLVMAILLKVINIFMNYLKHMTAKTETKMDDQLTPIIYRFLQFSVIIFTLIYILQKFEVNVTALFAGLSIGGLALALAAQDTVKNLIGSATIFVDRPFQIGDYIQGGGFEGTVVEVGFRTTRLKASDTSIISVPNGTIVNLSLTNKGVRVYRLYNTTLGLEYGTPTNKINTFMGRLKNLVEKEEKLMNENSFVGLTNLGASSLDIIFRFYIDTTNFDEEIKIKNNINLSILKIAEEVGVSFAFPSQTVYIQKN